MIDILARNWWALALRGVIAILFAVTAFAMPGVTLTILVYFFAAYLVVDGIFALVAGLRAAESHEGWGMLTIEGIIDLIAGVVIFLWPGLSLLYFIYFVGFWAIVSGVTLLIDAFRLHRQHGEWWMILAGLASLVWGVLVVLFPVAGVLVWAWWIAAYALIFGIAMLILAFRLRAHRPA